MKNRTFAAWGKEHFHSFSPHNLVFFVSFVAMAWIVCGLSFSQVAEAGGKKVTIVPFVPVTGKVAAASAIPSISKKLGKLLKNRGFQFLSAKKSSSEAAYKPPNQATFSRANLEFRAGKALMRTKKYEKAKEKFEEALRGYEQSLVNLKDFSKMLELYRLMGLCFFRLGLGEQGEQAIERLGALAPTRKYSVSKMPPAMRRVLRGAQRRALRGRGGIRIVFPSGSDVQFNDKTLSSATSPVVIKKLASGRHYLWVRKAGYVSFAEPIVVRSRGTTTVRVRLRPIPKAEGPDFSSDIRRIHRPLRSGVVASSIRSSIKKIASGLSVDYLVFGYFEKVPGNNRLSMFFYRRSDGALKAFPKVDFDLELLEADIKLISVANQVKTKLAAFASLPAQAWQSGAVVAAATPRPAPVARKVETPKVATAAPAARPSALASDDPSLDGVDDDSSKKGIQVVQPRKRPVAVAVVQPRPRPVVARPTPRPAPRPAGKVVDDDDDDDDDDDLAGGKVKPRPVAKPRPAPVAKPRPAAVAKPRPAPVAKPRPAPVVQPRPAPVVQPRPAPVVQPRPAPVAKPRPAPVVQPRPASKSLETARRASRSLGVSEPSKSTRRRRRVARIPSRKFDPDVDIDWSNPIPREARGSGSSRRRVVASRVRVEIPEPRRVTRRKPRRRAIVDDDDDDDPPPKRRLVQPAPRPRAARRVRSDWGSNRGNASLRRRPPPSKAKSGPITSKWWFWTAVIGGVAVAGGVTAAVIAVTTPANSFDVFVNVNPPE